jgi:hypothetical protein
MVNSRPFDFCTGPRLLLSPWALVLFALFGTLLSNAQSDTNSPGTTNSGRPKKADPNEPLFFSLPLTPEKSEPSDDTLPDLSFRMYNPARQKLVDYGTLGNLGSSARPMLSETNPVLGFQLGMDAFDLYSLRAHDLKFFRNKRSFSDAFFSQGKTNLESMLNARFSRTFSDGINFSLDYRSINNLGQYNYQRNRHNSLNAGFWVPIGKRYDAFVILTKNVFRQQDNGGIVSDSVFAGDQFQGPLAAEIRLPDQKARTRYDDESFNITHHFRLVGTAVGKRALRLSHVFEWGKQRYKFTDTDTISGLRSDTTFFRDFLVDYRGIRNFISVNRYSNYFNINTFKAKKAGQPNDLLAIGLVHTFYKMNQEPVTSRFSNLFLTGSFQFKPSKRFDFNSFAALGVLQNIGEYQLKGSLLVGLGKVGQLSAELLSQRRPVTQIQQRLFVSKRELWSNAFDKPVENTLSAAYSLPAIGFSAHVKTTLVNNYVYFDQQAKPVQTGSPLQLLQLSVTENLHWRWLHFDNTVALQQANRSDIYRLPKWFSKNSLYLSGYLFKKRMLLSTGIDFRINSEFKPDAYQPLTGQFYLQDTLTQKPYPWIDVFLAFKVQDFRFFVRYENCSTWWDKTKVFYQTAHYPQPFGGLRLGVAWRFMDDNRESTDRKPENADPTIPADPQDGSGFGKRRQ